MTLRSATAIATLAIALIACNLDAPFGYGLLFGTSSGYQREPAVVHAVARDMDEYVSVGLGDIADDGGFFLTLDTSPGPLEPLVGPGSTLDAVRGCNLITFDSSDIDAAGVLVRHLAVLERPGLVSKLDDPLGLLLLGTSPAAAQLFSTIGTVAASEGDIAQTRYYADRAVRLIGTCTVGNADIDIDLSLARGWNPLRLTVVRVLANGRVKATLTSQPAADLTWHFLSFE